MVDFTLNAEPRGGKGKTASRRLRREGKVPGILYGADKEPTPISLAHNLLEQNLQYEGFFSHILNVKLNGETERAILRDLQRHPSKPLIQHIDLQRISAGEKLRVNVPLHLMGEEQAPAVKQRGGVVSHLQVEVEVSCLPEDLPEYLELDISNLDLNESLRLSDIPLPKGVEIVELGYGEEHDNAVVSIHLPRAERAGEEEAAAEAEDEEEKTEARDAADEDKDKREHGRRERE